MKCINHPDKDAETNCSVCGEPICLECRTIVKGKDACPKCQEEWLSRQATQQISY